MTNKEANVATPRKTRSRGLRNRVSVLIDQVSNGLAALTPSRNPYFGISPDSRPKKPLRAQTTSKNAKNTTCTSKTTTKKTVSKKKPSKSKQPEFYYESSENEGCCGSDYEPSLDGLSLNGGQEEEEPEQEPEPISEVVVEPKKKKTKEKRSKKCDKIANKSKNGPRNSMTGNEQPNPTKYTRRIEVGRNKETGLANQVEFPKKFEENPKIPQSKAYIQSEFLDKLKNSMNLDEATDLEIFYFILSQYLVPMFTLAKEHTNKRIDLLNRLKKQRNCHVDMDELWVMWGLHLEFATIGSKNLFFGQKRPFFIQNTVLTLFL